LSARRLCAEWMHLHAACRARRSFRSMTSSDAGSLYSIRFPLPASQGRTHLRTSADCIACLCCSLTRVTGWVHAA
jgi:hypothetical protein